MPTYIQKDIVSDLVPGGFADVFEMSPGIDVDSSVLITIPSSDVDSRIGFMLGPGSRPNSDVWESGGTFTVEIEIDVGNHSVDGSCQIQRYDRDGNLLQEGAATPTQAMNASRVFSPVAPTWTASEEDCNNRLLINFIAAHTPFGGDDTITVGLGTTANEVVTDISENSGACILGAKAMGPAEVAKHSPKVAGYGMTVERPG